jgi:hypothetical protein
MKQSNYIWATDLNENSGEGILGRLFLREIFTKKNYYKIETPYKKICNIRKITTNFPNKNSFFFKYFYPIIGAIKLRINANKFDNLYYVNFLPLWNFLILLLLPKKTKLGPITGRSSLSIYGKKNYLLDLLYKISVFIIQKKFNFIIFSTSILKNYFTKKKNKKKLFFNFSLILYKRLPPFKSNYRPIDILIYNRLHPNKFIVIDCKTLKKLSNIFRISCIGDKIKIPEIKNLGYQSRKKVISLMKKSKTVVATSDNYFSFFVIDALYKGCKVIVKKFDKSLLFDKKYFINLNEIKNIKKFNYRLTQKISENTNQKIKSLHNHFTKFKINY